MTTCRCGAPTADDAPLCNTCTAALVATLAIIAEYADELATVKAKLTNYGNGNNGSRSAEKPLPYNPAVTQVERDMLAILASWCSLIADHLSDVDSPRPGRAQPHELCAYLTAHADTLRTHDAGPDALDEITQLERRIRRLVDRPPERVIIGRCSEDCGEILYAHLGRDTIRCHVCHTTWGVAQRRDAMLEALNDQLYTIAEIASLTTYLGAVYDNRRTYNLLNVWATRGKLEQRGTRLVRKDGRPDVRTPTYRFGDALDQLLTSPRKVAV